MPTSRSNQVSLLTLSGHLDGVSSAQLSTAIDVEFEQMRFAIVLDLAAVGFASSAGLRAILIGAKIARQQGGDVRLAAVQPSVLKVLELAGFTKIIQVFVTTEEATASFS